MSCNLVKSCRLASNGCFRVHGFEPDMGWKRVEHVLHMKLRYIGCFGGKFFMERRLKERVLPNFIPYISVSPLFEVG